MSPLLVTSARVCIIELLEHQNIKNMLENKNEEFKFASANKFKPYFLDIVNEFPFIFYVEKQTIIANTVIDDLTKYVNKIYHTESLDLLRFISQNFTNADLKDTVINCILIETTKKSIKAEALKTVIFLDNYIVRNQNLKISSSGRLDFEKLDNRFFSLFSKVAYKQLLKKPGKYFYQAGLGLNVHRKKSK